MLVKILVRFILKNLLVRVIKKNNMVWLKIPVLIATNMNGDGLISWEKLPVLTPQVS